MGECMRARRSSPRSANLLVAPSHAPPQSTVRRLKTTAPPPSRRQAAKLDLETKTAEFSAAAGAIEEAVPVRKETCLRLLADGFVNSFVDFFFLYHRAGMCSRPNARRHPKEVR